jgi:hypothetical protein
MLRRTALRYLIVEYCIFETLASAAFLSRCSKAFFDAVATRDCPSTLWQCANWSSSAERWQYDIRSVRSTAQRAPSPSAKPPCVAARVGAVLFGLRWHPSHSRSIFKRRSSQPYPNRKL